jgi:hypothetical protein
MHVQYTVARFLVPDWGDIVDSGMGLSYRGPPGYIGWRVITTIPSQSRLYPPEGLRIRPQYPYEDYIVHR